MEIRKSLEFEREEMLEYLRLCLGVITALKLQTNQLETIIKDMRMKLITK